MRGELTEKQKQFCSEYLIDLNATQSAIKAGYSEKTAYSAGQRLLKNVEIQALLQKSMQKRSKRTEITQDWVLEELRKIASTDGSVYAKVVVKEQPETVIDEETGEQKKVSRMRQFVEMENTDSLTAEQKAAISCIKQTRNGIEVGTYDKVKALELIGKHLGMFKDVPQGNGDIEDLTPLAELLAVDDE